MMEKPCEAVDLQAMSDRQKDGCTGQCSVLPRDSLKDLQRRMMNRSHTEDIPC